ncbi:MAG: trimethylamine methyltransferase family protein [Paracoccaceae bacterium]
MAEQETEGRAQKRSGGRSSRGIPAGETAANVVGPGLLGGAYRPLSESDVIRVHNTVLDVLEKVGIANPLPILVKKALERGCKLTDTGRLCFPRALVEDTIAGAARNFTIYARDPKFDLDLSSSRVHTNTGGESVSVLDFRSGNYRPSTLIDHYDFARLVDRMDNLHRFSNLLVATDIPDLLEFDINRNYAAVAGTSKGGAMSCSDASHMDAIIALFDMVLGKDGAFLKRPFCETMGCVVVSPLTYADDNCKVIIEATLRGIPVRIVAASQAGATAPAPLAGALVQNTAETLAGLIMVNLIRPGHPAIFGNMPLVSDLRTGAFTGGSGEQAILAAAAMQLANFYGVPGHTGGGMSDSKLPDNQAGYEKGITTTLSCLAGVNFLTNSAGTLASLMGASFESMVIDNDMLGNVLRAVKGIEVNDETLSYEVIAETVEGPRHYLSNKQTLEKMRTEFVYPKLANRESISVWGEGGSRDIRERARDIAQRILSEHYPTYISPEADQKIRERFPIYLPKEAMRPGNGRW